ncbi:MAG: hypothetical protein AAGI15_18080, partial [Pseudomonadota bacterium]
MQDFAADWGALNFSRNRERRFVIVVSFEDDGSQDVYIPSHSDVLGITGPTLEARLDTISSVSQQLYVDEGRATIGQFNFSAVDRNLSLTNEQRTQLQSHGRGLRNKRVRYYVGFAQLPFERYLLRTTQIIKDVVYGKSVYQFSCADIQRIAREKIMAPRKLFLAAPLGRDDTTIQVVTPPGETLIAVEHGTSYTDAPGETVAYVKIDDERIRVPAGGISPTQLTGVTRGVLGTRAAEHAVDENEAGSENGKAVEEVAYLEMPAPKMIHALLTGVLFGQSTTLPDHWQAGIAPQWVRSSAFLNADPDLYDSTDDTAGTILRFVDPGEVTAKRFIEQQICRVIGAFMPVHADGALGFKRMSQVLSGSASVFRIEKKHILRNSALRMRYRYDRIRNRIAVRWNEVNGETSRRNVIADLGSQQTWGDTDLLEFSALGLHGSRHSASLVRSIFDYQRDRYSGPPLDLPLDLQASLAFLEVGDVVRVDLPHVQDVTNAASVALDRSFEIQAFREDWVRGKMAVQLFGSSQPRGPLPPLESQTAIADPWFSSIGTNLATLSGVIDTGSELQLPDGLSLAGGSTFAAGVYYATKDVRLPSSATMQIRQNVWLRSPG